MLLNGIALLKHKPYELPLLYLICFLDPSCWAGC